MQLDFGIEIVTCYAIQLFIFLQLLKCFTVNLLPFAGSCKFFSNNRPNTNITKQILICLHQISKLFLPLKAKRDTHIDNINYLCIHFSFSHNCWYQFKGIKPTQQISYKRKFWQKFKTLKEMYNNFFFDILKS